MDDLDFEISFFEDLLRDDPNFADALVPLGDAYTKKGHYQKGLEVDLKLASLRPQDPTVFYNLACSYSLLGQSAEAIKALKEALRLGYRDFAWLEQDRDLDGIRGLPDYNKLIGKYFSI